MIPFRGHSGKDKTIKNENTSVTSRSWERIEGIDYGRSGGKFLRGWKCSVYCLWRWLHYCIILSKHQTKQLIMVNFTGCKLYLKYLLYEKPNIEKRHLKILKIVSMVNILSRYYFLTQKYTSCDTISV